MATENKDKLSEFEVQNKNFKEKYGEENIKVMAVPLNEEETEEMDILVRVPDRNIIMSFMMWQDKSIKKAFSILIQNCVLTDLEKIKADDDLYMCVGLQ